jgi:hypothetical protein
MEGNTARRGKREIRGMRMRKNAVINATTGPQICDLGTPISIFSILKW